MLERGCDHDNSLVGNGLCRAGWQWEVSGRWPIGFMKHLWSYVVYVVLYVCVCVCVCVVLFWGGVLWVAAGLGIAASAYALRVR